MHRQPTAVTFPRILASAALHSLLAVQIFSQAPVQEGAELELTFDEVKTSSRKNQLDLFKLNKFPNARVSTQEQSGEPTGVATKLTSIAQPPATQPPASSTPTDFAAADEGQEETSDQASGTQDEAEDARASLRGDEAEFDDDFAESVWEERQGSGASIVPQQNRQLSTALQLVDISTAGIGINEKKGVLPAGADRKIVVQRLTLPTGYERGATYKVVNWQPSLICHYPLYFEDAMLERHGHVRFGCFQSLASGAKFFGTLPLLPYLYTLKPKHECQYALGHYRAGSCAPLLRDHLPWDKKAAVVEALAWSSFFWAAPL